MPYLKYYSDERERWPELQDAKIQEGEAKVALVVLVEMWPLWEACGVKRTPSIRLEFTSGNRSSRGGLVRGEPYVCLNRDWMNWRVLAHELAHVIHRLEHNNSPNRFRRIKWHGTRHREITDWLARKILELRLHDGRLTQQHQTQVAASEVSPAEKLQRKLQHAQVMLAKAEKKAKIAETLMKRWTRRVKLYTTKLSKSE